MDLYLRRVIHPQALNNYRVLLKDAGLELEIVSIGIQHGSGATEYWAWAIDTVIPMREIDAHGTGKDQKDCMRLFKARGGLPILRRASRGHTLQERNPAHSAGLAGVLEWLSRAPADLLAHSSQQRLDRPNRH